MIYFRPTMVEAMEDDRGGFSGILRDGLAALWSARWCAPMVAVVVLSDNGQFSGTLVPQPAARSPQPPATLRANGAAHRWHRFLGCPFGWFTV